MGNCARQPVESSTDLRQSDIFDLKEDEVSREATRVTVLEKPKQMQSQMTGDAFAGFNNDKSRFQQAQKEEETRVSLTTAAKQHTDMLQQMD